VQEVKPNLFSGVGMGFSQAASQGEQKTGLNDTLAGAHLQNYPEQPPAKSQPLNFLPEWCQPPSQTLFVLPLLLRRRGKHGRQEKAS
jgi:hypothetical protein